MKYDIIRTNPEIIDVIHSNHLLQNNPFSEEIFLVDILVANLQQDGPILDFIPHMKYGDELVMTRAEDQLHPFHIWLSYEGVTIGEVPMENGIILARLMDAGKKLTCRISKAISFNSLYRGKYSRIVAKIYLTD